MFGVHSKINQWLLQPAAKLVYLFLLDLILLQALLLDQLSFALLKITISFVSLHRCSYTKMVYIVYYTAYKAG